MPITRSRAMTCLLVNQFATPGLGSLIAKRWVAGMGQLTLALTGFVLFTVWFVTVMIQYYGQISGGVEVRPVAWLGETGGLAFAAAWLWAWVTSLSLLREARRNAVAPAAEGSQ